MTKTDDFKVPRLTRAIKAARKQGLVVDGYEIAPDGTIRVSVRDHASPPPKIDLNKELDELPPMTGEAA